MKNAPNGTTSAILQGQAGLYRVAAELLLRRMVPYMPVVDVGVDLVVEGWTWEELGKKFGCAPRTARRRLDGSFAEPKQKYSNILQYENRWDLLTGALATLREANHIVNEPRTADTVPDTLPAR